ncbi:MAG: hypothetical protein JST79_01235 [Acidobacteria bacterium]|nr:hypothetical protein [Acidobacteriota bacterium]
MSKFFTRERFGQPQGIAGVLLLLFLAQCLWLISRGPQPGNWEAKQIVQLQKGLQFWGRPNVLPEMGRNPAESGQFPSGDDPDHSQLWYLIASAPLLLWPGTITPEHVVWARYLAALPELAFGLCLGASLWYVARRLYGNAGGYIALCLYCFSPAILRSTAQFGAPPEMAAAWGSFGAIFTAIAVAHTLYAPREVVFWNRRRILLLALSFTLAVGTQFSLMVLVPLTLGFMLYVAPTRRKAAVAIWGGGCLIAVLMLLATYGFRPGALWATLAHASFLPYLWTVYKVPQAYGLSLAQWVHGSPAAFLALVPALAAYVAWPRARYFGNTAPLLVTGLFLLLSVSMPHYPGAGFRLMALPFLFVFLAGVSADLLETRYRDAVQAVLIGLLAAGAIWNLMALAQVPRG